MQRYKCVISYDGFNFSGYQIQRNGRTVQSELEMALATIHKGMNVKVVASGRTDANVHAIGQVIHFDTPLSIPQEKWAKALNSLLSKDIFVKEVVAVDSAFHARFGVTSKEYRYNVLIGEYNVFKRIYAYHYPYPLNFILIKEAQKFLIGTHDFTSFCSAKTEVQNKVRTISEIEFFIQNDELVFRFVGSGFLYNMVRVLVGTLLDVGTGKISPYTINDILEGKNRMLAGKTAPGHGLYLWKVNYDN
jgi:tRNA pseudouridine38-40 synthase